MGEEVIRLRRARRPIRKGKVIAATDKARLGGAGVLRVERGRDVAGALGGLSSQHRTHVWFRLYIGCQLALIMTNLAPLLYAAPQLTVGW